MHVFVNLASVPRLRRNPTAPTEYIYIYIYIYIYTPHTYIHKFIHTYIQYNTIQYNTTQYNGSGAPAGGGAILLMILISNSDKK